MPSTERKIATMLFADLVDSTKLASSADPEQTRVMLDRFYDSMAEEIEATGRTRTMPSARCTRRSPCGAACVNDSASA
jgi:class 3 adenylate cyclase